MAKFCNIVTRSEIGAGRVFADDRRNPFSASLKSIERLCNVDQFCRSISSIIVFSGLPSFQTWAARSAIQVQYLARNHHGDAQAEGVHHGYGSHGLPSWRWH